ncbi:MAG: VOC family protein, partial [Cyanobacteria bacterium J083]
DSYLYSVFGFNQQAKLTFASLNSEDEPRAIALTEVQGITLPPPPQPQRLGLVVRVENLAETITALSKLGLKIIQANKFTVEPNLIFTEQAFEDYDGHLIILYQVRTG